MKILRAAIVAAKRTPIGKFGGALASFSSSQLGSRVVGSVLKESQLDPSAVDETIMGQVLTAGQGMNPARQAARLAGIPDSVPASMVSQVCGSGLRAVVQGYQQILLGSARAAIAGGQESMTNAPHLIMMRKPHKFGEVHIRDTIQSEGLTDAFYSYPMGVTAENIARGFGITRDAQDSFALRSHRMASIAIRDGAFADETVALDIKASGGAFMMKDDEGVRQDANEAALKALSPAFADDGTVTAGNSSTLNDGAAAVMLMEEQLATEMNLEPLAYVAGWAQAGVDPQTMGLGPIPACQKLLQALHWRATDVDLWELNEAFAAQSLAVIDQLGLDPARVNINGGAIALGHPIGASGARILVTLVHALHRKRLRRGIATLCIGGGMGIAVGVYRE